jgi:apolipoprotein N-acyltransferase
LAGALLVLALPPWDQPWALWLALPLLLSTLWCQWHAKASAWRLGMAGGMVFFSLSLEWLRHSSRVVFGARDHHWAGVAAEGLGALAVLGMALYCAFFWALWASWVRLVARPCPRKLFEGNWQQSTWESLRCSGLAALGWVACEFLRAHALWGGFGWNGLGVAFHQQLVLAQGAEWVGVHGLAALPVLVAGAGLNALRRQWAIWRGQGSCRTRLDFTLALCLLLGVALLGLWRLREPSGETLNRVRAVLVQPQIDQVDLWSGRLAPQQYERLAQWTRLYGERRGTLPGVDLVLWPENALPLPLEADGRPHDLPWHPEYFDGLLRQGDFALMFGTEVEGARVGESHVAAAFMRGSFAGRQVRHKVHLVPFGEYLPMREWWPFSLLRGILPGDFTHGRSTQPLQFEQTAGPVGLIPLICFEDGDGALARRFVRPEPQILVNLTNDGWFLQSAEPEVHLAQAKFRAIELRRPLLRATNTGVTCMVDSRGRVLSRLGQAGQALRVEGCLPVEVELGRREAGLTFYARWGDAMAWSCLVLFFGGWLIGKRVLFGITKD